MALVNGTIGKIVMGALIATPLTAMTFMGNGIINNRETAIKEHNALSVEDTKIRQEMVKADIALREKVANVKEIVTDIRLEQRTMTDILKRLDK